VSFSAILRKEPLYVDIVVIIHMAYINYVESFFYSNNYLQNSVKLKAIGIRLLRMDEILNSNIMKYIPYTFIFFDRIGGFKYYA
jgi:hypothetical protein